ncbi:2-isopropylmalate synthase [uncultured Tateyamaria sp.]|uniref:2-isopropylmalate synthase n=1 Tax=uncultured Tateyamaria sp. TaxID=455651 RepID=UPI002630AD9B|nr:2-isopropylmalate synthase [uncultured Tateyamaria sp.]
MKTKSIGLGIIVASLSASAAAAEVSYANAFATFHNLDNGNADVDVEAYGGSIEFLAGNFTFSGEAGRLDVEDLSLDTLSLGGSYAFQNGVSVGLDYSEFDVEDFGDSDIVSLFTFYSFSEFALGLSVGEASDLGDTVYSVFGTWDVTENGRVGIDLVEIESETLVSLYADYDTNRYGLSADFLSVNDLDILAVSGEYQVFDKAYVTGGLAHVSLGDDLDSISIGAKYEFVPGASAEIAYSRLNADGADDIDVVTFGLQYEIGAKTSPRRTVTNIINHATGNIANLTNF